MGQLRYFVGEGKERKRLSGGVFKTETAAHRHFRDVIEPELNGRPVARRDLTYSGLVEVFLERHARVRHPLRLPDSQPGQARGAEPDALTREIRVFTPAELHAVVAELGPLEAAAVTFAAATGMRPQEWASLRAS